jgi:hypothetical protein
LLVFGCWLKGADIAIPAVGIVRVQDEALAYLVGLYPTLYGVTGYGTTDAALPIDFDGLPIGEPVEAEANHASSISWWMSFNASRYPYSLLILGSSSMFITFKVL